MKISTKIPYITALLIPTITSGCSEEFGSDYIKDGTDKPALNYFYSIQHGHGNPTDWLYFGPHLQIETPDNGPVTAMEWNTTFSIESSFPLSDITIESTESWLTCKHLEGANFSLTAASNNTSFDFEASRRGHVYITPINRNVGDNFDYRIDVDVTQPGRDLILYADGKWLSSSEETISFAESEGTSKTYEVRADGEYTIDKGSNDSWFTVIHSIEKKTFYVTTSANLTNDLREGTITIALAGLPSGESKEITIYIRQEPSTLSGSRFVETTELILDRRYLLVTENICATPIDPSKGYGYLGNEVIVINDGVITQKRDTQNAFIFANSAMIEGKPYKLSEGEFMIVDSNNCYYFQKWSDDLQKAYDSFSISESPALLDGKIDPAYIFTATQDYEGFWMIQNSSYKKWIQYNPTFSSWGCYSEQYGSLPFLYILED